MLKFLSDKLKHNIQDNIDKTIRMVIVFIKKLIIASDS